MAAITILYCRDNQLIARQADGMLVASMPIADLEALTSPPSADFGDNPAFQVSRSGGTFTVGVPPDPADVNTQISFTRDACQEANGSS